VDTRPSGGGDAFRFGEFELHLDAYELRRAGAPVRLERQPMDLLILLVQQRGRLVTRAEIIDRIWGKDVFVDVETGVNTAVRKIRSALRDASDAPRFIETVPAKGYRFIAPVVPLEAAPPIQPTAPSTVDAPATGRLENRPTRGLITSAIAVALTAVILAAIWHYNRSEVGGRTLAVLPFENLSGDPERDYLADGLAEETIASLGQIDPEHVTVIGRTSVMAYKRTTKSLATIGRELGVDYLVESSIRAEGPRLRVTSKLIRVKDQVPIWVESYDREPASMLGLQRELSTAIARQVQLRLSPDRLDALSRRQTRNAEAYDLYLRGRGYANQRTPATTARAIEYFQRATALDPSYALAWAGLSDAYAASPINGDADPRVAAPRARDAAMKAVGADSRLAEAQFSLAYVKWAFEWDWPGAITGFRRALSLDGGHAFSHQVLGHALSQSRRHAEAASSLKRARELDPFNPMVRAMSSQVAFQARDYAAALEQARQAIVLDDGFWIGHMVAAQVYTASGQWDQAFDALGKAARLSGGNSKALSLKGYLLATTGRKTEARELLTTLESAARDSYVPPYAMALIYAGLGETDAVFTWLDRAVQVRDVHVIFLTVDPKWDTYRGDPRFAALVERCGFTRDE
jgi:TolB-like protein/DNA-binding winged helix-turn-helix (wHTH) protein/Flp pilus assembly protein TadD